MGIFDKDGFISDYESQCGFYFLDPMNPGCCTPLALVADESKRPPNWHQIFQCKVCHRIWAEIPPGKLLSNKNQKGPKRKDPFK
jgi:hypothetical protein